MEAPGPLVVGVHHAPPPRMPDPMPMPSQPARRGSFDNFSVAPQPQSLVAVHPRDGRYTPPPIDEEDY